MFSHNLKKVPIFYIFIKILSLKKLNDSFSKMQYWYHFYSILIGKACPLDQLLVLLVRGNNSWWRKGTNSKMEKPETHISKNALLWFLWSPHLINSTHLHKLGSLIWTNPVSQYFENYLSLDFITRCLYKVWSLNFEDPNLGVIGWPHLLHV